MPVSRTIKLLALWHIVATFVAGCEAAEFAYLAMQHTTGIGYTIDFRSIIYVSIVPALFLAEEILIDAGEITQAIILSLAALLSIASAIGMGRARPWGLRIALVVYFINVLALALLVMKAASGSIYPSHLRWVALLVHVSFLALNIWAMWYSRQLLKASRNVTALM